MSYPIGEIHASVGGFQEGKCIYLRAQIVRRNYVDWTEEVLYESDGVLRPSDDEVDAARKAFYFICRKYGLLFDPYKGIHSTQYVYQG